MDAKKEFLCDICGITANTDEREFYYFGQQKNGHDISYSLCPHCAGIRYDLEHNVLFPRLLQYGQHLKHARHISDAAKKYIYEDISKDMEKILEDK